MFLFSRFISCNKVSVWRAKEFKVMFCVVFFLRAWRPAWSVGAKPFILTLHSTPSFRIPACVEGELTFDPQLLGCFTPWYTPEIGLFVNGLFYCPEVPLCSLSFMTACHSILTVCRWLLIWLAFSLDWVWSVGSKYDFLMQVRSRRNVEGLQQNPGEVGLFSGTEAAAPPLDAEISEKWAVFPIWHAFTVQRFKRKLFPC